MINAPPGVMAMAEPDPSDRFKDLPALMNPTTPALRRLRARLEGQPLVIQRDPRRHRRQTPEQAEARRKNSEAHARRRAEQRPSAGRTGRTKFGRSIELPACHGNLEVGKAVSCGTIKPV